MKNIISRFKKYIKIDTMSNEYSNKTPSTNSQIEFGKMLVDDMIEIGLENVYIDNFGYVYGTILSNVDFPTKTIGFIAHMDTAPAFKGGCNQPFIIDYKGGDIEINKNFSIKANEFPFLNELIGQTLITTDGTTLLGADDKAGIVEILEAMKYIIDNPNIKHGDIKIAFTPDEEIGSGANLFNIKDFNADFAYTIDGGSLGEFNYENFNAASADIKIYGRSIHPGDAKNKMINSIMIASELQNMLPEFEKPEYTENYEGFYLLENIDGSIEQTNLKYIIRDHNNKLFSEKKELLKKLLTS